MRPQGIAPSATGIDHDLRDLVSIHRRGIENHIIELRIVDVATKVVVEKASSSAVDVGDLATGRIAVEVLAVDDLKRQRRRRTSQGDSHEVVRTDLSRPTLKSLKVVRT